MPDQLGPIDIDCDAPPYGVVQACAKIGFRSPLDVQWCRMDHFLDRTEGERPMSALQAWLHPFGWGAARERTCCCGQALPLLEPCSFAFPSGEMVYYSLGQCDRCRTIFWQPEGEGTSH